MSTLVYTNPKGDFLPLAQPVANTINSGNGPNKGTEDRIPNEGQININTANWRTLSAIPWKVPAANATAAQVGTAMSGNVTVAKAIVSFRNAYGPFKTLLDLNKVPGLQYLNGDPRIPPYYTSAFGNISPLWWTGAAPDALTTGSANTDNVLNDFENRFATINRVSNLITTRSDTYTVYVLVQGWSGVGTATPSLVVQRRTAFIADRSQLTASNPSINITPVQAY